MQLLLLHIWQIAGVWSQPSPLCPGKGGKHIYVSHPGKSIYAASSEKCCGFFFSHFSPVCKEKLQQTLMPLEALAGRNVLFYKKYLIVTFLSSLLFFSNSGLLNSCVRVMNCTRTDGCHWVQPSTSDDLQPATWFAILSLAVFIHVSHPDTWVILAIPPPQIQ